MALPLAALLAPLAAELAGAAAPVLLLVPLEHAAASTATPTAPPTPAASLAGDDIRFTMGNRIVVSCPVRPGCARPHFTITVDTDYGGERELGLDHDRPPPCDSGHPATGLSSTYAVSLRGLWTVPYPSVV
jgi:hypothetical protein